MGHLPPADLGARPLNFYPATRLSLRSSGSPPVSAELLTRRVPPTGSYGGAWRALLWEVPLAVG